MTDRSERAATRLMAFQYALTLAMQRVIDPGEIITQARVFEAYLGETSGHGSAEIVKINGGRADQPDPAA